MTDILTDYFRYPMQGNPFDLGGKMKINDLKKCLEKAADCEDGMADEHDAEHKASGEKESHHSRMRDLHKAKAANFREHAEKCDKGEGDELGKSGAVADLAKRMTVLENTVVPSRIAGVVPTAPTAVPRAGQRPMERPNVPIRFEKLVAIEEE